MKFSKPALSIPEQIDQLKRRGMIINDQPSAEHYLLHISYYRLRAYWMPFEVKAKAKNDHQFADGTSIDQVVALYIFDRRLRLLVMDAIERIEISIRGAWAHHLAMTYGPHGYLDPNIYAQKDAYAKTFNQLLEDLKQSKDTFIEHYKNKYDDPPQPPVWMVAEILTLGQLSKWLSNLASRADRQAIAKTYGLDEKVFCSLLRHLAYVRNICAHHARLWNKRLVVTMKVPSSPAALKLAMNSQNARNVYNTLAATAYLMKIVAPDSEWRANLVELVDGCAQAPKAMGFPDNWKNMAFWR